MDELQSIIVFHGRHFVRHLGICNPICVKLLQIMSGVIPHNLKEKRRLYLTPFFWRPQTRHTHRQTHTHTHTHTHTKTHTTLAIGEMQCVAFRPKTKYDQEGESWTCTIRRQKLESVLVSFLRCFSWSKTYVCALINTVKDVYHI